MTSVRCAYQCPGTESAHLANPDRFDHAFVPQRGRRRGGTRRLHGPACGYCAHGPTQCHADLACEAAVSDGWVCATHQDAGRRPPTDEEWMEAIR